MGRSRAERPTLAQKKQIEAAGLNSRDWLVLTESVNQLYLVDLCLQINGIQKSRSELTGNHPTASYEFDGHIG